MLAKIIGTLFCLCALLLVGCTKTETTNNNPAAGDKKAATPAGSPAMMSSSPDSHSNTMSGNKIGVPECDDFLAKYEACVTGKVPEAARAQFTSIMSSWRTAWHNAASTPQGKAALATTCKSALEQSRTSMSAYNCAF